MICGPKGSGKSTFAKFLVNSVLSRQQDSLGSPGVAFLDLDPGQPEFHPPGSISLMLLNSFVTSAYFTHDIASAVSKFKTIKSHFLGYLTPRDDPSYYLESCVDLLNLYRNIPTTGNSASGPVPLVINCCGWILGTGLDILVDLICRFLPSDVIYMSTQGPEEVGIRLTATISTLPSSFHTLTSQPFQLATQDSSELRLAKMLSYFHQRYSPNGLLRWKFPPLQLSSEVSSFPYAGEKQTIHGIVILGDETNLGSVAELIEDSALGIVLVEDEILSEELGLNSALLDDHVAKSQNGVCSTRETPYDDMHNNLEHQAQQFGATRNHFQTTHTPDQIPWLRLRADGQQPFKSNKMRGVGQILIYKVDRHNCSFEATTPVPRSSFDHWRKLGFKIVLVRGQLDVPAWTNSEQFAASLVKRSYFFQHTMTEEKICENLFSRNEEAASYLMYDIDPLEHGKGWADITHAASTVHSYGKVWRSRKSLRYIGSGDSQTTIR